MGDETIAELERALRAAPDDTEARLRLATALARAGRGGEGLDALPLAAIPRDAYPRAKQLSERLWRDEVAALERAAWIEAPGVFGHLAWTKDAPLVAWQNPTETVIANRETGQRLEVVRGATRAVASRRAIFVQPGRHSPVYAYELDASGRLGVVSQLLDREELLDVSPAGDRITVVPLVERSFGERWEMRLESASVLTWPGLERIAAHGCPRWTFSVDWERRVLTIPGYGLEVAFDGGVALERVPNAGFSVGHGLLVDARRGMKVHHLPTSASWELVKGRTRAGAFSLARDGRRLRFVYGPKAYCFEIVPPRKARKTHETVGGSGVAFHPDADLIATGGMVADFDGRMVVDLGADATALDWSPDGRALAVKRSTEGRAVELEIWR